MELTGGWEVIRARMRERVGESAYAAWFSALEGMVEGDRLVVTCPDRFSRDWVRSRYGGLLEEAGAGTLPIIYRVRDEATSAEPLRPQGLPPDGGSGGCRGPGPGPSDSPAPARPMGRPTEVSFDTFVSDPGNVLALEAARAVARGDAGRCSPLLLTGVSGVGKTHLCRAIQRERSQDSAFLSSEEFTAEVTQAIRNDQMAVVRRRYRRALNVLILEDLQFLRGKKATQVELFHTLDHLISRGKTVVLTADRPPHELQGLNEQLTSRIACGLIARIEPPELETRRAILREKAAAGGVGLPEEGLELLARRPVDSVRELLAGLNQVVARSTLLNQRVTLGLVREALAAVEVPGRRRSLQEIMEAVSRGSGVTIEELRGRSRKRRLVRPRQLAMYLCRRYTDASLKEIGIAFDRDHTSVMYAVEQVEKRNVEEPQLRYELEALAARLSP